MKGLGLMYMSYETREIKGALKAMQSLRIKGVVGFRMKIARFSQRVYAYVVPKLAFPMILENPWKAQNKIRTTPEKRRYYHGVAKKWVIEGHNHHSYTDNGIYSSVAAISSKDIRIAL